MTQNSFATDNYSQWSKDSLIRRIRELEGINTTPDDNSNAKTESTRIQAPKKQKKFDFSKYSTRHIALRFSYLGWNYQGLAIQSDETDLPTVEYEIIKGLNKIKLVDSLVPQDFNFSRCGRTDRGVSAMNQVISLRVRSNLTAEELNDPTNDIKELDYVRSLNQVLPPDIRFHSVCLRPPPDFDARFSCKFRHYKYIFNGEGLNVSKMREAASYYLGENDFRNFCKIDASKQITNYKRTILKADILELKEKEGFYVFDLKGTAFLWHQVRCMVAVLFAAGQGLEEPTIVKRLLDIHEFPSRPVYHMAHDIPLVLYDCGFDENEVQWVSGPATRNMNHHRELDGLCSDYQIKSLMSGMMKDIVESNSPVKFDKVVMKIGDGMGKTVNKYIPFEKRNRLETAEETNSKWLTKKRKI
ncbi:hypothetical protein CANARDRAFT_30678 [[Candida] arabinofermentans NRRL YB-2248]|uniref:Pseudouridine synthase I TruA alpha/beta domain-containing protein n=1 Tax=[Candida] arabinofermentans NRRL YB-2248 TaxID=983967 RepID=A0A1E4ST75_9ASCO|nr:hypothetical protein CANARDRAFT_30678 [[Candida] arabinofermentans NRRL YB-2248]